MNASAAGPRPGSKMMTGEDKRAVVVHRGSRLRLIGGRRVWGSGCIPSERYLTTTQIASSTGTTILVIEDPWDITSTLRSCNFTVRTVPLDDPHIRHEILVNITEGAVMGVIVGLKGPAATALVAN